MGEFQNHLSIYILIQNVLRYSFPCKRHFIGEWGILTNPDESASYIRERSCFFKMADKARL